MKKISIITILFMFLLSITTFSHTREMMMEVVSGSTPISKTVKLYTTTNLVTPFRQGTSYNYWRWTAPNCNVACDINDNNTTSPTWSSIPGGTYRIRIDDRYAILYIPTSWSGSIDFMLRYSSGNFSKLWGHSGVTISATYDWVDPLVAYISGPTYLGFKQSANYTANASGGTGSYSYQWWRRNYPYGTWYALTQTTQTVSNTMSVVDFELKVKVTSGSSYVYDTHIVYYDDGIPDLPKKSSEDLVEHNILNTILFKNYPNPFNPSTNISYQIKEAGFVSLKVYNILGEEIAIITNEFQQSGIYNRLFDASNLPSGIYIYRLTTNNFTQTNKMLLTK